MGLEVSFDIDSGGVSNPPSCKSSVPQVLFKAIPVLLIIDIMLGWVFDSSLVSSLRAFIEVNNPPPFSPYTP